MKVYKGHVGVDAAGGTAHHPGYRYR